MLLRKWWTILCVENWCDVVGFCKVLWWNFARRLMSIFDASAIAVFSKLNWIQKIQKFQAFQKCQSCNLVQNFSKVVHLTSLQIIWDINHHSGAMHQPSRSYSFKSRQHQVISKFKKKNNFSSIRDSHSSCIISNSKFKMFFPSCIHNYPISNFDHTNLITTQICRPDCLRLEFI